MLQLCCLVIGDGSIVPVSIEESMLAGFLSQKLKATMPDLARCDPHKLTLYLAKKGGDKEAAWLNLSREDDAKVIADLSSPTISTVLRDTHLKSDLQIHPAFQLNNERNFGASSPPSDGVIHVLVELPESRPFKKARIDHGIPDEAVRDLANKIKAFDSNQVFNIDCVTDVPFPSLSICPRRFQCDNQRCFKYQTRQELKPLYDRIMGLWNDDCNVTVNVSGAIGYGKSHMLAMLVLLLLKNRSAGNGSAPFVCYIPDCGGLLFGRYPVVNLMKRSILLQFPDYALSLDSIEDIRKALANQRVLFVADGWNWIDNNDPASLAARENLDFCLGSSVLVNVHGMSMYSEMWCTTWHKQTTAVDDFNYQGGFSDDEFDVWLQKHSLIFKEHKDELARLTGKIPLLLSVFDKVYQDGDSWERIVLRALQDTVIEDWTELLL